MHPVRIIILLVFCVLGMSACVDQVSSLDTDVFRQRSEGIAQELKATLGLQLKSALQSGGPVPALQVCKQVAQPLTRNVSEQYTSVSVSRTALKVRNPENRANVESTSILERWLGELSDGRTLEVDVAVDGSQVVVHHPLMTEQVCLKCHGSSDTFPLELQTALDDLYPEDEATEFELGELRGAIRVEFFSE